VCRQAQIRIEMRKAAATRNCSLEETNLEIYWYRALDVSQKRARVSAFQHFSFATIISTRIQ